jgi:polar amino acid transport system substrate-binding protein
MKKIILLLIPLLAIILNGCDDFPKDANGTLKKAENKVLRVGVAAYDSASKVSTDVIDDEVKLVNLFAEQIHSQVTWVKGSQTDIIELLHNFDLDIGIGGFTSPSPLEKEVAFTHPYQSDVLKIGGAPNEKLPGKIKGQRVWVTNLIAASFVKKEGGIPILTDTLVNNKGLIAANETQLIKIGAQVSNITLKKDEHVFAIPKGENALLMKLEKFLEEHGKSK